MARLKRLALPGNPHLLLQRAHNGGCAALDEADAGVWRTALQQASRDHALAVHAYALWPQGFVLLATPAREGSLGLAMQSLGRRYGAHFNRRHLRSGGLWDGRFRATVVQPQRLGLAALQWVESAAAGRAIAPRAGAQAQDAEPEPLASSRAHHLGRHRDPLVEDGPAWWDLGNTPFERESAWARLLEHGLAGALERRIAEAVEKGWALGEPDWAQQVAQASGRRVAPLPRGRPRKATAQP